MKKTLTLVMCLLVTTIALAENGEDRACDQRKPDFESVLELTDDQKGEFSALLQQHREEHKAMREQARTQMQDLHEKHQEEMKAILTEEQFKKFDELMGERREHHKGKRHENRSEMRDQEEEAGY